MTDKSEKHLGLRVIHDQWLAINVPFEPALHLFASVNS